MKEQVAQFRFKGYNITKSVIDIDVEKKLLTQMDVSFIQTSGINIENSLYKHTLVVKVSNDNQSIVIEVKAEGLFEFDSDLKEEQKTSFFSVNAPSILFPYVRAYITALTSLSGIPPIILPTLNLSLRNKTN